MSDLISRCELFNRLATIPASPEANELKAQIYAVIQSMDAVNCTTCRFNKNDWDSIECDGCTKADSNYEPMKDCQWR